MKALVYKDGSIALKEREYPKLCSPKDAIVKVAYSSICTSDLHIKNGFVPRAQNDIVLGHEFVGEIVEVGADVKLQVGDRVSANCITFCGECYFCKKGFINNCEKGGWELGCRQDGCQAEYVRVPFADMCLTKIPDNVSYKQALFVGDILASGYFGVELCSVRSGESVAVIGAGPVGLCSMRCARLFTDAKIIAIDIDESRLEFAKLNGLADITVNPEKVDIEDFVKSETNGRGADNVIEAAGTKKSFETSWKIARPNATVAVVAMYEDSLLLPLPEMYGKNLVFKTGGVDAIHSEYLLDLISQGKISTDLLISKEFSLDEIEKAYELFEQKTESCLKFIIRH